jgi:metacaspase-1
MRCWRDSAALVAGFAGLTTLALMQQPLPAPEPPPPAPVRRALLVAVENYRAPYPTRQRPERLGWRNLHTRPDAENMKQVLREKYGFQDGESLVLLDEQATRTRILEAFRNHLIASARPGGVAVFMFAGHGQQVADDNGDEADGMDESLVPYDYVTEQAADGARTNLRDDDLQRQLKELSRRMAGPGGRVQGNITILIDSCFSGSMVRGSQVVRGRGWDTTIDGPKPTPAPGAASVARPAAPRTGVIRKWPPGEAGSALFTLPVALATGYVALTACQSFEAAYEHQDEQGEDLGGAFLYHVCAALRDASPRTTYRDLFERVKIEVGATRANQTPTLEGKADQLLFSGVVKPAPVYPLVERYSKGVVTLNAGRLHGITPLSRYALFRPGSEVSDPSNRLADVTLAAVDTYRSTAELSPAEQTKFAAKDLIGAKAVLLARHHGQDRLRVLLDGVGNLGSSLQQWGSPTEEDALQLIPVAPQARGPSPRRLPPHDVRVTREAAGRPARGQFVVRRDDNTVVGRVADTTVAGVELRQLLTGLWRWRVLNRLWGDQPTSPIHAELQIIPVNVTGTGEDTVIKSDRTDVPQTPSGMVLREGDHIRVAIRNLGREPVYVTVLNLQSDGSVAPVFPHPDAPGSGAPRIEAGGTLRVPFPFRIQAPFGTDVFRLIATLEPVDFTSLLYHAENLRGEKQRQAIAEAEAAVAKTSDRLHPLARLLLNTSTGRRAEPLQVRLDPTAWGTAGATIETRPR